MKIFNVGHLANFKDKLIVNLHLSFPVRSISRGNVIGIALTRNESTLDAKTLSSLLKYATFLSHEREPEVSCLHTTTIVLLGIFSLVETISLKIWEKSLSWHAKYSLPVSVRDSETSIAQALYYLSARTERAANGQTLKSSHK